MAGPMKPPQQPRPDAQRLHRQTTGSRCSTAPQQRWLASRERISVCGRRAQRGASYSYSATRLVGDGAPTITAKLGHVLVDTRRRPEAATRVKGGWPPVPLNVSNPSSGTGTRCAPDGSRPYRENAGNRTTLALRRIAAPFRRQMPGLSPSEAKIERSSGSQGENVQTSGEGMCRTRSGEAACSRAPPFPDSPDRMRRAAADLGLLTSVDVYPVETTDGVVVVAQVPESAEPVIGPRGATKRLSDGRQRHVGLVPSSARMCSAFALKCL